MLQRQIKCLQGVFQGVAPRAAMSEQKHSRIAKIARTAKIAKIAKI